MTRRILSLLALVLVAALPSSAADGDVTGKWKLTSSSSRGERVSEIVLAQEGEKLVVTSQNRQGEEIKSEGEVKGTEITWTTKRETPMGELVIVYRGKIEGKTMAGTTDRGGRGTGEWKAERVE